MNVKGLNIKRRGEKGKTYHIVGTVPESNRKIVEMEAKPPPLTHIHDHISICLFIMHYL